MQNTLNEDIYNRLKTGKLYDVTVLETHNIYEKFIDKNGYKNRIRFLNESGIMTKDEVGNAVCNLQRQIPGGSHISVIKILDIKPVTLTKETSSLP